MLPLIQTKQQLLDLLTAIRTAIEQDDSFEGSLEYQAASPGNFNVMASFRTGNSQGQGSVTLVGDTTAPPPPDPPETCPACGQILYKSTCTICQSTWKVGHAESCGAAAEEKPCEHDIAWRKAHEAPA